MTLNEIDETCVIHANTPGLGWGRASSLIILVSERNVTVGYQQKD